MTTRRMFSKSTPSRGRSIAFQWAGNRSSRSPQSVLYLQPPDVDDENVTEQWSLYGSPIEFRCERFRTLVDDLYEADTYEGPTTHVSVAERQWIVEEALTRIDDTDHPLYSEDAPSVGLIEQTEELLTLLEFASAITSTEVEQRLTCEGLPEHGQSLSRFVELVHEVREDGFEDTKTFQSERFRHVLDAGKSLLESELSATDVVVVGSFQTLSPLERDVVGLLADTFDTGVVLTRVADSDELTGADSAIRRLTRWYEDLGFTGFGPVNAEPSSTREIAAASLYQHDDGATDPVRIGSGVSLKTHATVQNEIRGIARSVRSLIGSGVDPSTIAVAPFDDRTYGDRLADTLRDADVPVSIRSSRSFFATTTGKLFEAAINLGIKPNQQAPLVRLLSNPLVFPEQHETTHAVLRNANLLESTRVPILTTQVNADAESLIRDVVTACERFVNAFDVDAERQALFDALGVPVTDDSTSLTETVAFSRHVREREQQAIENAIEVCASLTARREATEQGSSEEQDIEAVRRALKQVSVETSIGRRTDSVRVCAPGEAVANSVEYVYVPGLTTDHTPSPPRRLAFARSINDAHPDLEAADPIAGTRYAFAQVVASDADVTFSAPERNPNGDPYVLADPLLELKRVTGLEADRVDGTTKPATRVDVHRSLATAIDTGVLDPPEVASNVDTYDIAIEGSNVSDRLAAGVTVAAARAKNEVGEYDGHIDPEVVVALRGEERPYSPSRLETYADCGFKYYLKHILGIEPDEEITLELNALDAGTYVHDVFERFYREWHSRGQEDVTEDSLEDATKVLYEVAEDRLAELDTHETVFHDTWVAVLFDGLDVPENRYGDVDAAAGLFKRFLDAEVELAPREATPTYFEAHVGLTPDETGPEVISDDPVRVPGTDISIRGKIDRIDITSDGGLVGIDYKTGSTPSESDTIDGHAFQLSAYLLMAENALGGDPVGASYYKVNPTSSVSPHDGTIGGEEDATHAYWGKDDPEPLRRYRSLTFDTREEFSEFIHNTVPDRIERVSTAVDNGSFHPTVLDPDTAGCEYCPYRDACDVRHHRRHAIHGDLVDANTPQYAPGLDTEATQ